jgi:hypothetical protein
MIKLIKSIEWLIISIILIYLLRISFIAQLNDDLQLIKYGELEKKCFGLPPIIGHLVVFVIFGLSLRGNHKFKHKLIESPNLERDQYAMNLASSILIAIFHLLIGILLLWRSIKIINEYLSVSQ